jgi:serine/threonine protein kinase
VNTADEHDQEAGEGERLGRYTLVHRLGKGGMGEVFLAKSTGARGFEKLVAIKRILPQYSANRHVVNMLVDEARISVLLNHPNVVQVLELDEDNGSHFIVMEYVDGHALSRLTRRLKKRGERVDPLIASYIVMQVLEGLQAAHTQKDGSGQLAGIIHRDISPQNVLLSMDGQVKVIDFGIARARDRLEATRGSQVKGKLRYMAPEQIKPSLAGEAGIDHRVDVFAAGIVLFELMAMRNRFVGQNDIDIIDAILEEETPDLRAEGLVDDELQAILDKALHKERRARYKDAGQFATALRSYLYARDPGFSSERVARLMRGCFGGPDGEGEELLPDPDERTPPPRARARPQSKNTRARPLAKVPDEPEPDEEETRTQLRPLPPSAPRPRRRRSPKHLVAALLGAVLGIGALVGVVVGVREAMKPRALVVSAGDDSDPGNPPGPGPVPARTPGPAPTATTTPAPPPSSGLVDHGGGRELVVVASPPSTRISLAYQPDPKFVSPARLKVQPGETVELYMEAEGHEPLRTKVIVTDETHRVEYQLKPIPQALTVRPFPRDAEVLVNGAPWRGGKLLPGEQATIQVRHPFYLDHEETVTMQPGRALVLDITLKDRPVNKGELTEEDELGLRRKPALRGDTGIFILSSDPPSATVFIDGRKLGNTTPIRETLPVGSHRVTVRVGDAEQTFTVEIKRNATVRRGVTLQ